MACGTPALGLAVGGACDALADGELGTALGREDDLAAAIDRLLTGPRTSPCALAGRTHARFGRDAFASQLLLAVDRICLSA
jgi:phosphatidylinositol alpha-1,6-mannosyltransferase